MSVIIHLLIMQKSSQLLQLSFALWGGARGKNQLILASAEKFIIFIRDFYVNYLDAVTGGCLKPILKAPVIISFLLF